MKPEKNVQNRKSRDEQPLGDPIGDSSNNPMFAGKLHGTGQKLRFDDVITPRGGDEKETTDPDGS